MQPNLSDSAFARSNLFTSAIAVCGIYGAIFLFFSSAGPIDLQNVTHEFNLNTNLANCDLTFSRLAATQIIFSFATAAIAAVGLVSVLLSIYTNKRNFWPYAKLLSIVLGIGAFGLLPWLSGDVFLAKHFDLTSACLASHHQFSFKAFFGVAYSGLASFVEVASILYLHRMINLGRDPSALSDDPKVREAQLGARQLLKSHRSDSKKRLKLIPLLLIGLVCIPVAGWLAISMLRAYHNVAWEKADARLVSISAQCTIQSRELGKKWETAVATPCVTGASADPSTLTRKTRDPNGKEWRMKQMPTVLLSLKKADGTEENISARRDVFMPVPVPMGTTITIVRDPNNPGRLDRQFGRRDWMQLSARLFITLLFAAAVYFFYVRKPLLKRFPEISGRRREMVFGRQK